MQISIVKATFMAMAMILTVSATAQMASDEVVTLKSGEPAAPPIWEHAKYARWMVNSMTWGFMSTISTQDGLKGMPFGNVASFADGGTGNLYMCVSALDSSIKDLLVNPNMNIALSAMQFEGG